MSVDFFITPIERVQVFIKIVGSSVYGKVTGILYVAFETENDLRVYLNDTYKVDLAPGTDLDELVAVYGNKKNFNTRRGGGFESVLLITREYYLKECLRDTARDKAIEGGK